jgi:hypothetical protein
VTARRNPNLILLTISLLINRPDMGLVAVAAWTILSSLLLLVRLGVAFRTRVVHGPLHSWLADGVEKAGARSLALRLFTQHVPTQ